MLDLNQLVTNSRDLPEQTFEWGTLKWLCSDVLSPRAEQTLGICHIKPDQCNPLHYHPNCEEVLYVLSGRGKHRLDGQAIELQPGATIRIPAGVQHNFENVGSDEIVCLICFSSGKRETVLLE